MEIITLKMSRKINDAIELVFDIVKLRFVSNILLPQDFNAKRWISGDATDINWLAHCKILHCSQVSTEIFFVIVQYDNQNYFVAIGYEDPQVLPVGLTLSSLNAGLFTTMVSELELPLKGGVSDLQLIQNVLSQSDIDTAYKGHDFIELKKYFPNIVVAEITPQFGGDKDNLFQIVCMYLTANSFFLSLSFSSKTLDRITDLVLLNSDILDYESVFQALLSSQFKFAFLDVYRCIEMLYQIIYIEEAYSTLNLTISKMDFLSAIDSKLRWKPIERVTLEKIVSETPTNDKSNLINAVFSVERGKKVSDWVYDLRCSIVHLKTTHIKFTINPTQWDKVIYGMIDLLIYWYRKYPTFI